MKKGRYWAIMPTTELKNMSMMTRKLAPQVGEGQQGGGVLLKQSHTFWILERTGGLYNIEVGVIWHAI